MKTLLALFLCLAPISYAEEPPPLPASPGPLKLTELFGSDANPGRGSLSFQQAGKEEKIELGGTLGFYGLGMIFTKEVLPETMKGDWKDKNVIQIALGTVRSRLEGKIPQWGAATIISVGMPKGKVAYKLMVPSGKDPGMKEMALMLFTSPSTPAEQSDEEKLKGTYFAQSGFITVTPINTSKIVDLQSQGRKVRFRTQVMRMKFTAKLVTPFNAQESSLLGTLEFPVYWPYGREAETLTRKIATDSMGGAGAAALSDAITKGKRTLATPKK